MACIGSPYTGHPLLFHYSGYTLWPVYWVLIQAALYYFTILATQCGLYSGALYRPPSTIVLFWLHSVACIVGSYTGCPLLLYYSGYTVWPVKWDLVQATLYYFSILATLCGLYSGPLYRPPSTISLFWLHRVACILGSYTGHPLLFHFSGYMV